LTVELMTAKKKKWAMLGYSKKDAKNGRPTNYSCLSTCYSAIKDVIYTLEYT